MWGGCTVLFGARGLVGWCCCHYHTAGLMGDTDEEIVDLLQIDVCHRVVELAEFGEDR